MKTEIPSFTGGNAPLTVAPVAVPGQAALHPVHPEFIRLPKSGNCPWSGLTRSKINELVLPCKANGHRPPVKSVSLRQRGAKKGVRLVCLASLLAYLHERTEGGNPSANTSTEDAKPDALAGAVFKEL